MHVTIVSHRVLAPLRAARAPRDAAKAPRPAVTTRARPTTLRRARVSRARASTPRATREDARDDAPRARARTPRAVGGSMDDAAVVDARAGWRATLETTAAKWRPTVELGALFAGWYYFSIAFNVYQKALLKAVPMPLTATFLELAIGSALVAASWGLGAKARPDVKTSMLKPIATLGMVHMLGNALTNVSLGKVAVSFTHTVKALEPVFSVGLSAIFLGNIPSLAMCASLVPIIAGVMIASATEVSFNMAGFLSAMGSNLTFQSRNVLSKFVMTGDDMKKLDYVNLLGVLTIASTVFALPLALAFESSKMNVASIVAGGMPLAVAGKNLFMAALCFQLYQQLSFMVLSRVNPVTHSVGNSLKRVAVIAASVIIFRNPVSTTNIIGTTLAIFGVILYGRVKKQKSA
jgi:solute carrier family 35 protein E1